MTYVAAALLALTALSSACVTRDVPFGRGAETRPMFASPWMWTDENGVKATFARWRGSVVVTTGFYASCTVRCPMTIAKLREIDEALRAHGRSAEFVLVTIDPDNDTVDRLRRLKASRDLPSSWHLLHGSREDTYDFGRWLHLNIARDSGHMDHDAKIAVFDSSGRLVRSFEGWNFDESDILATLH